MYKTVFTTLLILLVGVASMAPRVEAVATSFDAVEVGELIDVMDDDGTVEQTTAYYTWGAPIADLGTGSTLQPFKWGGKEHEFRHGLNLYDFTARTYDPILGTFLSVDPRRLLHAPLPLHLLRPQPRQRHRPLRRSIYLH